MRILVCDDNADTAHTLAYLLKGDGHEVAVFHDGRDCLQRALEWRPDVAFLDLGLPSLSGFAVARRLRAQYGFDVVLVAVTGYGSSEDRTVSFESGFDVHLVKPVSLERIAAIAAHPARLRSGAA